jgi:hypothetical protein
MSPAYNFDKNKAFDPADQTAREQESQARLLLWDVISEKAANNEQFRQQLAQDPEKLIQKEANTLSGTMGQIEISKDTVANVAEKARKTFSSALPEVELDKVEKLIFGTIEDMRTSFKLTLLLSRVLFFAGLAMVVAAFIVAMMSGKEMVTIVFGAGGVASVLISSLVLSPISRVQNAASDLVQLQMAYLTYYKQLYLLSSNAPSLTTADTIAFSREIDRATISLITTMQSNELGQEAAKKPAKKLVHPKIKEGTS